MKTETTFINDLIILTPTIFEDDRGYFCETYSEKSFLNAGINIKFVQDNHSLSFKTGTLRGLHFQNEPMAQTKLVRCTRGEILDVAVDLRENSPTYKKWFSIVLSEENKKQLLVPKGFAHGFITLKDNTEVQYKVDNFYSKEHDRAVRYNDPELAVDWSTDKPVLSEKDANAPSLKDADVNFEVIE